MAKKKGYRVLVVDLPRNPIAEQILYEPYLESYRAQMQILSESTGAVHVDLHGEYDFPPTHFYDHIHLLDHARPEFQERLVDLMFRYLETS